MIYGAQYRLCRAALPDPTDRTAFIRLMAEASAKGGAALQLRRILFGTLRDIQRRIKIFHAD